MKSKIKIRIKRPPKIAVIFAAICSIVMLSACNVTRTVKTESTYFTKGDTTCTIVTKTIETYDASKKLPQ